MSAPSLGGARRTLHLGALEHLGPLARPLAVAVLAGVYVFAFPALFRALRPDVAALFVLAVLPAGVAYGLRGGIVAGGLALPVHLVLLRALGPGAVATLWTDWAGAVTGIAAGVAAGVSRDLLARRSARAVALALPPPGARGARREWPGRGREPGPARPDTSSLATGIEGAGGRAAPRLLRPATRAAGVAAVAAIYAGAFPFLFAAFGPDVAALFVLAVLPASLAYGLPGGVLAGAIAVPAHVILLDSLGPQALAALSSDWAGAMTGVAVGVAAGAMRDLLLRVRSQAAALERERVRLEGEIVGRERIERELARANGELDRAREIAERASRAKSVLLGRASHELRTPVAAVLGYVELLQEELLSGGPATLGEDLERVRAAAGHLASLLDDLLDLTRLESGHLALQEERISVGDLAREIAVIATPLAARRGNRLEVEVADPGAVLTSDRRRVEQIALNLLANAAKFTAGGTIRLAVRPAPPASIELSVSDDGVGMTAEQRAHAFDEFYRADPFGSEGSGLGLPICRHLCRALGGEIRLRSAPGAGTTFTVSLPVVRAGDGRAPAPPA